MANRLELSIIVIMAQFWTLLLKHKNKQTKLVSFKETGSISNSRNTV